MKPKRSITVWLTTLSGMFAAIALYCSCADKSERNSYVQDRVDSVTGRTAPSDATIVNISGPTLSTYSATAHWEFETTEERTVYLLWVRQQLEHDGFKLKSSDESNLNLTTNCRSERESVTIHAAPSDSRLRVQVTYLIDSD